MKKILVINGPNLNMLGIREPDIYGSSTYQDLQRMISDHARTRGVEVSFFQSNHEGALVDAIQQADFDGVDGISAAVETVAMLPGVLRVRAL